ncbi:hypothetical protein EC957_002845 [Mortierella hygrophila]|uniref:Uncharacterized protein n=1 Tax=Mortierella hygrophila TaxID=979708 RepID=A0A9P6FGV1_9FUNG|nr:hypothetical protein EC957_002845 [Mortierella hygrophila]
MLTDRVWTDDLDATCETTIAKRDDEDTPDQETEAREPEQEQELIVKEGDKEDEEHTSGGQDPTEPVPDEITNPSPSSIVEPTDSGSDQEPTPTTIAGESEPTPTPSDEEDKGGDRVESGHEEEPTPAATPDDAAATTTDEPEATTSTNASEAITSDSALDPTDSAVAITSSSTTTITSQNRPSGQTDPTATKASKDEGGGPTTLLGHKEETRSNTSALTAGVIVAAVVIASVIGVWIFRKWKLSPSRHFKNKITGGFTKGGAAASAVVYGSGKGHDDHSEYNSYDEIIRPEAYDIAPPSPMTSVTMAAPAYPVAVAGSEYEYGYAHYEQMQQQQTMGGDANYQSYQYGYNSGAVPATSEASALRASVTSIPNPNVIGGVPAVGHNIHGYGSEDYTRNDHFLRELRE